MSDLDQAIRELVIANRVLAYEDVVDAYGHVSIRHPDNPKRYLLSRSRSPELVGPEDIMEFELDGTPVRGDTRIPYVERHIHGAIYERRPEIMAAVHSHAEATLPYGISTTPLRPVIHSGGFIGKHVPVWDINDQFGDTNLLVTTFAQGRDLAERLGPEGRVCLMRGHGFAAAGRSLADVLRISIYIPKNARVLTTAMLLGGGVKALTPGEIEKRVAINPAGPETQRAWEYWAIRSGCAEFLEPARTTRRRAAAAKAPARKAAAPKSKAKAKPKPKPKSKPKAATRARAKSPARGRTRRR